MRLLIDTHVLIWLARGDQQLPHTVRATLEETSNEVFVSAVSGWEVSVKHAIGRLDLRGRSPAELPQLLPRYMIQALPITYEHGARAGMLPPHHADPFDRMLIAQAQLERLTLVSRDAAFGRYDVDVLW